MSLIVKLILLMIAIGALIVVTLWALTTVSTAISVWINKHPYETGAIGALIFLSIVAFLWRIFLWKEE